MTYIDYKRRVEFGEREFTHIERVCRRLGMPWFASPWDVPSVEFLERFAPPCYKVASASLTDHELLAAMRETGRPLIMSTGMSTAREIDAAVEQVGTDDLLIRPRDLDLPVPGRRAQPAHDLVGYGLIQSYVLGLAIAAAIRFIDEQTGLSRLGLVSDWPVLAQLGFFFVTHDFYIYWFHRLQHYSDRLWRIHEAHHSVDDVDWLSGTRSHSLEILINQTIEFLPIVLLGAAPEVALMKATLDAVWGMYIHSNLNVKTGPLKYVINGPEMHRWHHARDLPAPGKNFATKLAIWDFLFGTAHRPDEKPARYGSDDERYPKFGFFAYLRQHWYAFRR